MNAYIQHDGTTWEVHTDPRRAPGTRLGSGFNLNTVERVCRECWGYDPVVLRTLQDKLTAIAAHEATR